MRAINWIKFKNSPKLHINVFPPYCRRINMIEDMGIIQYDNDARILSYQPSSDGGQIAFFVRLVGNKIIVFDDEQYAHVIRNRISSLPEHKEIFKNEYWLTTADRDYLFNAFIGNPQESSPTIP